MIIKAYQWIALHALFYDILDAEYGGGGYVREVDGGEAAAVGDVRDDASDDRAEQYQQLSAHAELSIVTGSNHHPLGAVDDQVSQVPPDRPMVLLNHVYFCVYLW